jgi:hypothetical protein
MRFASERGFLLRSADVRNNILTPRYYDPRIAAELDVLASTHNLRSINQLIADGALRHDHGSYIPKIFYGSGPFPYVRTSDLANWELKASPKHGMSKEVYDAYHADQDVQSGDIFFVHEGTYLIGAAAMVTPFDGPVLYQHHLAKFRVLPGASFDAYFLLAALEAPVVRKQVRSKQFSADIIDSVVGRLGEVVIPVPKDKRRIEEVQRAARDAILGRAEAKQQMAHLVETFDAWLRRESKEPLADVLGWKPDPSAYEGRPAFLGGRADFRAFAVKNRAVVNDILLPRYYDPEVKKIAKQYSKQCDLVEIGRLEADGLISTNTGDEVGKMAYGTGDIPFVRTSDLASWELKRNPKQGVSRAVYEQWAPAQEATEGDILLVRDGTYLVGTSAVVSEDELPLLYCGGIIRLRSRRPKELPPMLLFGMLNLPFVRQQMRRKQFTRDVIDTLGNRLSEVVLPVPRDPAVRSAFAAATKALLSKRNRFRSDMDSMVRNLYAEPGKTPARRRGAA